MRGASASAPPSTAQMATAVSGSPDTGPVGALAPPWANSATNSMPGDCRSVSRRSDRLVPRLNGGRSERTRT